MKPFNIIANAIVGAVVASFALAGMEHWNDQELRAKGCVAMGRPGVMTELTKGVSVIGRVWFCQEKAQ